MFTRAGTVSNHPQYDEPTNNHNEDNKGNKTSNRDDEDESSPEREMRVKNAEDKNSSLSFGLPTPPLDELAQAETRKVDEDNEAG